MAFLIYTVNEVATLKRMITLLPNRRICVYLVEGKKEEAFNVHDLLQDFSKEYSSTVFTICNDLVAVRAISDILPTPISQLPCSVIFEGQEVVFQSESTDQLFEVNMFLEKNILPTQLNNLLTFQDAKKHNYNLLIINGCKKFPLDDDSLKAVLRLSELGIDFGTFDVNAAGANTGTIYCAHSFTS